MIAMINFAIKSLLAGVACVAIVIIIAECDSLPNELQIIVFMPDLHSCGKSRGIVI